jgi:SAM-dependent methyltransferase
MNPYFVDRPVCPCCGSNDNITLRRVGLTQSPIKEHLENFYTPIGGIEFEYLEGSDYVLNECRDCGLIYQKEVPNEFLMSKLYGQWIDPEKVLHRYHQNHDVGYYLNVAKEIGKVIRCLNMPPHQVKFFDFAMGWGSWCMIAKGFRCDVYGLDLSQERCDNAYTSGIQVIGWDQIPEHQFDIVNAEQVFEHLADPLGTLRHLKRGLRPGGLIRIGVPRGWDIKRKLEVWDWHAPKGSENSLIPVAPLQHINCFDYNVLVRLGVQAGLKAIDLTENSDSTRDSAVKKIRKAAKSIKTIFKPNRQSAIDKRSRIYLTTE